MDLKKLWPTIAAILTALSPLFIDGMADYAATHQVEYGGMISVLTLIANILQSALRPKPPQV
jgi:hypothetical protein